VERTNRFQLEHIIPQGVVEFIFNFSGGPPIPSAIGSKEFDLSRCFINGFNSLPIQLQLPERQVFFGVRLQPLTAKKILKIPASEFSDIVVDLTLLNPSFDSLWHQLADQNSFDARVSIFCQWMEKDCIEWQPQEQQMNHFLYSISQHDLSVKDLANSICYSPRHLSRKILEVTGMNTEELLLYKKYLHAVHLIHHTDLLLTEIAYQSNFADQSHFIKAFKTFALRTPSEYSRSKGFVKGHILENVR
jgi:AraC-like DNA-binding protein